MRLGGLHTPFKKLVSSNKFSWRYKGQNFSNRLLSKSFRQISQFWHTLCPLLPATNPENWTKIWSVLQSKNAFYTQNSLCVLLPGPQFKNQAGCRWSVLLHLAAVGVRCTLVTSHDNNALQWRGVAVHSIVWRHRSAPDSAGSYVWQSIAQRQPAWCLHCILGRQ